MSRNRKSIKDLLDGEIEKPILEGLYLEYGVATDQLQRKPEILIRITRAFNRITSHAFDSGTLLRYMVNRRKQKDWPRLGVSAKKFESVLNLLTSDQLFTLKQIYLDLDIFSDEFLFEPELKQKLEERFAGLTGTHIPGYKLVAAIVAKRKRGEWLRISEDFGDIEMVG
ncbi:MAG: hypothetical protein FVQ82_17605 [Planctomycetes bacterium]|nr:hypothetical protein [Planctomycetota bacterium]